MMDSSASIQPPTKQQPKALRFVTNYGAPHPKRRRIGAACLTCRKRKTACSGERPFCDTCKQNKLDCAGYSAENAPPGGHKRAASDAPTTKPSDDGTLPAKPQPVRKRTFSPSEEQKPFSSQNNDLSRTISAELRSPGKTREGKAYASDTARSVNGAQQSLFSGPRNRMPYFRWLGPTAIMPGFKQMVVKVKRQDTDIARSSTDGRDMQSPSLNNLPSVEQRVASVYSNHQTNIEPDIRTPLSLPSYDTSPMPPSELITHLANTFFTHLGCNYPFLQRERFMKDLMEKQVDAILLDSVCALAARFSTHELLTQSATDGEKPNPAEYGHAFAQRAKMALVDAFPCPSVAAAQAALLLAYNEFGEQRDSGLWMYLGISIRIAQDLGLHKLQGLKYVGRDGPTPRALKQQARINADSSDVATSGTATDTTAKDSGGPEKEQTPEEQDAMDETIAVEQERVDTFWAIFFLDRVVSSGTGRRSTLRDKDIELSFPSLSRTNKSSDWPEPFPALIRIVHLYGRVADLLNSINRPSDITLDTPKRLAAMESQVTTLYQNLSPRLHFDAVNFQHYMKAGEGTNFVLLHFWFHTLIVLLHQPTLLLTFEGRMLQLFPNSQQLSMSSAKTIADILSYSQLMDAKASLGNPFTTQPIYIAACAFLRETVEQTATSNAQSRSNSPIRGKDVNADGTPSAGGTPAQSIRRPSIGAIPSTDSPSSKSGSTSTMDPKSHLAKHTLLATAASQHYQLCYKALQSLETYWAGTKYILTVLNQKFEGVGDPLLYTAEEGESSMEQPRPEPAFTSPGWRRKLSWGANASNGHDNTRPSFWPPKGFGPVPGSPRHGDAGKGEHMGANNEPPAVGTADFPYTAIGWTLTGTMNSPSTNLAWHYASDPNLDPRLSSLNPSEYEAATGQLQNVQYPKHLRTGTTSAQRVGHQDRLARPEMPSFPSSSSMASKADSETLVNTTSSYGQQAIPQAPVNSMTGSHGLHPQMHPSSGPTSLTANMNGNLDHLYNIPAPFMGGHMNFMPDDMIVESHDVDMSALGLDMMPWFGEYESQLPLFQPPHNGHHATGGAEGAPNGGHHH